jgi:gas vesicle protein
MSESNGNNQSPVGGYLTAVAIGALVGAGIALLYAPYSGKETRKLLKRRAGQLKNRAADVIEDAKETIQHAKEGIAGALDTGKEALHGERAKHSKHA